MASLPPHQRQRHGIPDKLELKSRMKSRSRTVRSLDCRDDGSRRATKHAYSRPVILLEISSYDDIAVDYQLAVRVHSEGTPLEFINGRELLSL